MRSSAPRVPSFTFVPRRRLRTAGLGALLFGLVARVVMSQTTVTWENNGSSRLDQAGNWVGDSVPTSGQVALFNSTTFSPNELAPQSSSVSFGGISLAAGAGALSFTSPGGGSAKTMSIGSSGIVNSSANSLTFDITSKVNLVLVANATFTAHGPIFILDDSHHGSTNGFSIGGHTLTLDGPNPGSTIEKGFVGSGGKIVKAGSGTWAITGANSYTGSTTLEDGVLAVSLLADGGMASGIGQSTNAAANLAFEGGELAYTGAAVSTDRLFTLGAGGGTIDASGTGALTFTSTGSVAFSGSNTSPLLALTGTNTGTLSMAIGNNGSGATSLAKTGAGTWILAGANTLSGTVTVSAGTLTVNSGAGLAGSSASLVVNGGTLNLNHAAQTVSSLSGAGGTVNLASGQTFTANQATTTSFAGTLAGPGRLVKTGAGTLALSGTNTYTGGTTLDGGTLVVSADGNLGASSGSVTFAGGTLQVTAGFSAWRATTLDAGGGTFDVASGATLGWNGNITGASGNPLTKIGPGTLLLGGTNSYAGDTNIDAGILRLGTASALSPNSRLNVAPGAFFDANGFAPVFADLSGSGSLDVGPAGLAVQPTGDSNFTGVLSGSGGLTMSGSGTLTLGNANTFTGGTTISAGTLILGAAGALPSGTPVTLAAGATLDLNGFDATLSQLEGTGGNIVLASASLAIEQDSNTTFSGVLSGSGGLTLSGSGTLTLGNANTFTGATTISAGTLKLGAAGALPSGTPVTLATGATLDLNGFDATLSQLEGAGGNISLSNASLVVEQNSNTTFSGVLIGSGGLAKSGSGILTLSGTNTFSGATNVTAGELKVNGSAANSPFTIFGGTLSGNGAVGTLTVASGGTVAPGNSPGLLTINGDLTLAGTTVMELGGTERGINYDAMDVTGSIVFGGTLTVSYTTEYTPLLNHSFNLFSRTGSASSAFSAINLPPLGSGLSWNTANLYSSGTLSVVTSAIPEPGSYAVMVGFLALGLAMRWRRSGNRAPSRRRRC